MAVCVFCIVLIKRNIVLEFSLKIIAAIMVINIGFISNQVFSEMRHQTLGAMVMQAVSQGAVAQYIPMG